MQSTKQKILIAAARLFRKQGYNGTSMNNIADEVGIKAASIYNHFKSKQLILQDLLLNVATHFTKGMNEIETANLKTEEKLERLIALHVRLTVEHTDAVALIVGEWVNLEEPIKTTYLKSRNEYEKQFKNIIEQGKTEEKIKSVDTEIILFSTLSTLHWLYSWYNKNSTYNVIELERQMTICLMNGIKS